MPPPLEQMLMNKYRLKYREAKDIVRLAVQDLGLPPGRIQSKRGFTSLELREACHRRCAEIIVNQEHKKEIPKDSSTSASSSLEASVDRTTATEAVQPRPRWKVSTTVKNNNTPKAPTDVKEKTSSVPAWRARITAQNKADASKTAEPIPDETQESCKDAGKRRQKARRHRDLQDTGTTATKLAATKISSPRPRAVNQCHLQPARQIETALFTESLLHGSSEDMAFPLPFPANLRLTIYEENKKEQEQESEEFDIRPHSCSGRMNGRETGEFEPTQFTPTRTIRRLMRRDEDPLFPGSQRSMTVESKRRMRDDDMTDTISCTSYLSEATFF